MEEIEKRRKWEMVIEKEKKVTLHGGLETSNIKEKKELRISLISSLPYGILACQNLCIC